MSPMRVLLRMDLRIISTGFCVACPVAGSSWEPPKGFRFGTSQIVLCFRSPHQFEDFPARTEYHADS